jgi:hypothetical protein
MQTTDTISFDILDDDQNVFTKMSWISGDSSYWRRGLTHPSIHPSIPFVPFVPWAFSHSLPHIASGVGVGGNDGTGEGMGSQSWENDD